jgi:hypothetical protein
MPVSIKERITTDLQAAKVQNQRQKDRIRTIAKMVISEAVSKMGKKLEGISHP